VHAREGELLGQDAAAVRVDRDVQKLWGCGAE
jgi:hypothetical protein